MKVRLSNRAARDPMDIADYLVRVNPSAAQSVGAAIAATQQLISDHRGSDASRKGAISA